MLHNEGAFMFTNADVSCEEGKLLSRSDLMRLAESKTKKHAFELLRDFGYNNGKDLDENKGYEYYIDKEQHKYHKLINEVVPHREDLRLFLVESDYHNLKVILKSEFMEVGEKPFLLNAGSIDSSRLEVLVRGRNYIFFSDVMKRAILEATEMFSKSGDPQEIDIIFDKACYREMIEAAKRNGTENLVDEVDDVTDIEDPFLLRYVEKKIDLTNLKTFMRLRQINKPVAFFMKLFLKDGQLSENIFTSCYEEPFTVIAEKLAPYGLKELVNEGGKDLKDTGSFSLFEKLCDNDLIKFIKQQKYEPYGISSTAAFLLAKDCEMIALRQIFSGIYAGISSKLIIERLRDTYV